MNTPFLSGFSAVITLSGILTATVGSAAIAFPEASQLPSSAGMPDPLVMRNGDRVTTAAQWNSQRKPELKELFQHYMYGCLPPRVKILPKVDLVDTNFFVGKATLKLVTLGFARPEICPIHLMIVSPNMVKPAPVFVALNFNGNHALLSDPRIPLPQGWVDGKEPQVVKNRATDAGRGLETDRWAIEKTIDRGYAIAAFYYGDVEPDRTNAAEGTRASWHLDIPSSSRWGAVAAWAWGAQRVVDYVEKDKNLDRKHIAVVGHSRLGKATLLAAAFDDRIGLAFPHQAGCGGTAPSRGKVGESVTRINTVFPHWFCEEFKAFGEQPDRLPFDQNCLIALCAPRPVLVSCAVDDTWSNPAGQFESLQGADPAYRLLGTSGLSAAKPAEPGVLLDSTLGYFIRPGGHSMTAQDWQAFLDFADKQWGTRKLISR